MSYYIKLIISFVVSIIFIIYLIKDIFIEQWFVNRDTWVTVVYIVIGSFVVSYSIILISRGN